MRKNTFTLLLLLAAVTFTACGDRSKTADAASDKPATEATKPADDAPYADTNRTNEKEVTLGGRKYFVRAFRTVDRNLPVVEDEVGKKFYDNRVELTITRDGEAFCSKTFTKADFDSQLSDSEKQGTVFLGMAFDESGSDAHAIRLGAQIGQPGIEEGPAFIVEVTLSNGEISIVRDKNQDSTGDDYVGSEEADRQ